MKTSLFIFFAILKTLFLFLYFLQNMSSIQHRWNEDEAVNPAFRNILLRIPKLLLSVGDGGLFLMGRACDDLSFDDVLAAVGPFEPRPIVFHKTPPVTEAHDTVIFGDFEEGSFYRYNKKTKVPIRPFNPFLLRLKQRLLNEIKFFETCGVQKASSLDFNLMMIFHFNNGSDSIGWHQDDELEGDRRVAMITLYKNRQDTRVFEIEEKAVVKDRVVFSIDLKHGDLLFMLGHSLQRDFHHRIPKTSATVGPRLTVTFRVWK
jgi:alkylated DNA repair dioxygenase AlkB